MAGDEVERLRDEPEEEQEEEDEEELVDPHDVLKESCGKTKSCSAFASKLQECNDRVNSKTKTEETCSDEIIDYLHCVDHCKSW
ncbi:cytochrome b-c1 complex subunit 6, mitochondrial, partial [Armadillidium vulgare]